MSVSVRGTAPVGCGGISLIPISARSLSMEMAISLHTRVINSSSRSCVRLVTTSETDIVPKRGVIDCSALLCGDSRLSFRRLTKLFLILCNASSCRRATYALVNTGSRISCFSDIVMVAEDRWRLEPACFLPGRFTC